MRAGQYPIRSFYENNVRAPEAAVRGVLDFLSLEPALGWLLPLERFADAASDEVVARYLELAA